MGSNGAARPGASTAPPAVAATPAPTAAAPLASLAEIVSSIEIPPEEMAKPDNAVGADTLARLLEDKRKDEAAARQRVVSGTSESVRVYIGGRSSNTKQRNYPKRCTNY